MHVIHLNENIGGAGGFHEGFKYIFEHIHTEWLVCYDDDAYPDKGSIANFISLNLEDDVCSVAAAVYHANGSIGEMNRPRHNPFWHWHTFFNLLRHGKRGYYVTDKEYKSTLPIPIDASTFVGYFLRTKYISKLGLPRKELFIYADDLIYTMQAYQNGLKHIFMPRLKFIHDCETFDQGIDVYSPLWKVYYTYRNRIEMLRLSTGLFFYPLLCLQIPKWKKQKNKYANSELFNTLLALSIRDGLKQNFTRSHQEILKIIDNNK